MTPARVGIIVGLILSVAVLLVHARLRDPKPDFTVVSEADGALSEVMMHYVPELEPTFSDSYRDFLASLDRSTRVVFVVRRGDGARLDAFLARVDVHPNKRVVEVDVPLGIWSKDRALVLEHLRDDKIELVIPPRPRAGEGSRPRDWDIAPAVAEMMKSELATREIPIAFDAGDFDFVNRRVVFDVNLFERNRSRGVKTPTEMRERVRAIFGGDAIMLGERWGDVPKHHMSMYMALLDHDTALVGDPRMGEAIVGRAYEPGETSPETHAPLRSNFSDEMIARFDRAAADLARAGFRVMRIPTVPFDDKTYFAYTNGIYETRAGERIARVPSFDVPALDAAARRVYESLGWRVIPIASRHAYADHGAIGCLVNVLRRR